MAQDGAPRILHFLTPLPHPSPFDVNMAVDAGFVVATYPGVGAEEVRGLVQDAMFSRAPADAPKTCVFLGGHDPVETLDALAAARGAMFPPFEVCVMADPSGAFTTAAAMVACVERELRREGGRLKGARVSVFGATGPVGGAAALMAAQAGAAVALVAHRPKAGLEERAALFKERFGVSLEVAAGTTEPERKAALAEADAALACGKAGVQVLSRAEIASSKRLRVVADVNAVPPLGVEGVKVKAKGEPIEGAGAKGIGALAIGDVKFRLQHALLRRLRDAAKAEAIGPEETWRAAVAMLAEKQA